MKASIHLYKNAHARAFLSNLLRYYLFNGKHMKEESEVAKRMRRKYRAKNGVIDETEFWVSDKAMPRRGKCRKSDLRKQEANRNQAVHILARKLNNNFQQGDLFFTLTYTDRDWRNLRHRAYQSLANVKRATKEMKRDVMLFEAEKDGKLLIRRLREAGLKDVKYMLLGSDMDGDTKEDARVHVHLVITGKQFILADRKLSVIGRSMEEYWGHGAVDYEFLRGGSYAKLAAYLIRQTRDIKNHKRYVCSRNMEAIEYEEVELEPDSEPLQAPAGAKVEEYQHDPTNRYGMVYIRYIEPATEDKSQKRRRET